MEVVELGKVVKLHGYLGLMKVNTKFDKGFDIKKITKIYDEKNVEYAVTRIFSSTDAVVVGLEGVDLEKAKTYIGRMLYIDRSVVGGKILFEDLKNSNVFFENEKELGTIVDVQDFGAAEVISLKTITGREIMFPNAGGVIVSFDYKTKKLILSEEKFRQVCDYEDWYFDTISWNVCSNERKHFEESNRIWAFEYKHY